MLSFKERNFNLKIMRPLPPINNISTDLLNFEHMKWIFLFDTLIEFYTNTEYKINVCKRQKINLSYRNIILINIIL